MSPTPSCLPRVCPRPGRLARTTAAPVRRELVRAVREAIAQHRYPMAYAWSVAVDRLVEDLGDDAADAGPDRRAPVRPRTRTPAPPRPAATRGRRGANETVVRAP